METPVHVTERMNIFKRNKPPTEEEVNQAILEGKYSEEYSEDKFNDKLNKTPHKIMAKILYPLFVLYGILSSDDVPKLQKVRIISTLGYFISPVDLFPDFLPGGFADDILALVSTLKACEDYATDEIKEKARQRVYEVMG